MQNRLTMPDIGKIIDEIDRIRGELILSNFGFPEKNGSARPPGSLLELTRFLIKFRRSRGLYFGADLFADPAWDMLLDLFVAEEEGRKVSIKSLCIGSEVPPTTALRWIKLLIDRGVLERQADPKDRRRHWIALTAGARERMRALLFSMGELFRMDLNS